MSAACTCHDVLDDCHLDGGRRVSSDENLLLQASRELLRKISSIGDENNVVRDAK
jgi:hypothetical protein